MIRLVDYAQLRMLAWQRPGNDLLDDAEALALYEANWRHLDPQTMDPQEAALIERLVKEHGGGLLLV